MIDPFSNSGAMMAIQMQMMWQQQYPVRFGFTLDCSIEGDIIQSNDDDSVADNKEKEEKKTIARYASTGDFCRLFAAAREVLFVICAFLMFFLKDCLK